MRLMDKKILENLMNLYSLKEIIHNLSELSLDQASKMSDFELSDSAKDWSKNAYILQTISKSLK